MFILGYFFLLVCENICHDPLIRGQFREAVLTSGHDICFLQISLNYQQNSPLSVKCIGL